MFKTRLTEMFGVEHPIVMGGMTGVGYADLDCTERSVRFGHVCGACCA